MTDRAPTIDSADQRVHKRAASAFVDRARAELGDAVAKIIIFGSTARGETRGIASDVDVMVVLETDTPFGRTADTLRDIAYDVMLEYGPVVELHLLTHREYEQSLAEEQPFVQTVESEGIAYG